MNDEISRREGELNEAALDQVSGGFTLSDRPRDRAFQICGECRTFGSRRAKCSGGPEQLTQYQEEHGNIPGYSSCPFRS